jgi:hypothetical protein
MRAGRERNQRPPRVRSDQLLSRARACGRIYETRGVNFGLRAHRRSDRYPANWMTMQHQNWEYNAAFLELYNRIARSNIHPPIKLSLRCCCGQSAPRHPSPRDRATPKVHMLCGVHARAALITIHTCFTWSF